MAIVDGTLSSSGQPSNVLNMVFRARLDRRTSLAACVSMFETRERHQQDSLRPVVTWRNGMARRSRVPFL